MRRDDLYLGDILDSAASIERYLTDLNYEAFMASDMERDAVLMRLVNIGEACACISQELRDSHPEVRWGKIKAFRNLAVHAYFSVDWLIVWNLASIRVPELAALIAKIIDSEPPQS